LESPAILRELLAALRSASRLVTTRAANALKKVAKSRPDLLAPRARSLLRAATECEDLKTRWNLILVIGSLPLQRSERALAVELLFEALASRSAFLCTFAITGLANLAADDPALRKRVQPIVHKALQDPSPAIRARARKLTEPLSLHRL